MKIKKIKIELLEKDREELNFYKSLATLAQVVYNKRQALSLTQKDLARACGTTQRIISNIENAELNIGIKLLFKILKFLGIDLRLDENSLFDFSKNKNLAGARKIQISNYQSFRCL